MYYPELASRGRWSKAQLVAVFWYELRKKGKTNGSGDKKGQSAGIESSVE